MPNLSSLLAQQSLPEEVQFYLSLYSFPRMGFIGTHKSSPIPIILQTGVKKRPFTGAQ